MRKYLLPIILATLPFISTGVPKIDNKMGMVNDGINQYLEIQDLAKHGDVKGAQELADIATKELRPYSYDESIRGLVCYLDAEGAMAISEDASVDDLRKSAKGLERIANRCEDDFAILDDRIMTARLYHTLFNVYGDLFVMEGNSKDSKKSFDYLRKSVTVRSE